MCSLKKIHHVLNAGNNYEALLPLVGLIKIKHKTLNIQYPERHQLFHVPKVESQAPRIKSGQNGDKWASSGYFHCPL